MGLKAQPTVAPSVRSTWTGSTVGRRTHSSSSDTVHRDHGIGLIDCPRTTPPQDVRPPASATAVRPAHDLAGSRLVVHPAPVHDRGLPPPPAPVASARPRPGVA